MALGLGTLGLTLLYGAACFVLTASGLWALGSALGRPHAGAWAACLLAIWPGHVLCSTLTEKELLTGGLLPWLLLATWQAGTAVGWTRLRLALCAGLVNGALLLLQPSLQLLLPLAGVLALLLGASWRRVLVVAVGVLLGTALLVTPWALRNLQVLDRPALVSSNGGSVLYRANNELANGVYQPRGAIELKGGGEVQTDAQYKRLAVEWIVDHPLQFARLSLNKMLLFMGDHSYGAFVVFKRGGVELQRHAYLLTRLLCTLPWVALCLLLALEVCRPQRPSGQSVLVWLGLLPLLYLLGIHAVFESGSKYNLPALPTLLLAVQAALSRTSGLGRQC